MRKTIFYCSTIVGLALAACYLFGTLVTHAAAGEAPVAMQANRAPLESVALLRAISVPFGIQTDLQITRDGGGVAVAGHADCPQGGGALRIRAMVMQTTTAAIGTGIMEGICAETAQTWHAEVQPWGNFLFAAGPAEACAVAVVQDQGGDGAIAYQWCKAVLLQSGAVASAPTTTGAVTTTTNVSTANVSEIVSFAAADNQFPEGVEVDAQNNIYVGMAPTGEIKQVTANGEITDFAQLPSPGDGFMTGMILDESGTLYVALASFNEETDGVYTVSVDGSQVERLLAMGAEGFPNDFAFDDAGNLYVSNTSAGQILLVDSEGNANVWAEDPLLKGAQPPQPPLNIPLGANGIDFDSAQQYLYVANTDKGQIVRIPVQADGSAGAAELFVQDDRLMGGDGLIFDANDNLFVAVNAQDSIVKVTPDGTVTVLAQGGLLQNPASLVFGQGEQSETLYITNFAIFRAMGAMQGEPMPGLLKLEMNNQ